MSDHHSIIEQNYIPAGDGWDDAAAEAAERMIRGQLLKFADRRWTSGTEATQVADGTKLVAVGTVAAWVRWEDGKPVEQLVRRPGERLPERDQLSHTNEREWPNGPGNEPQDPWQNTRLVYLLDPDSAEALTFSTSSWGGRNTVISLGDQIARMRITHPDAAPVVELRWADMPTKHGKKSKPVFKIVGRKNASRAEPAKGSTNAQLPERPKGSITITSGRPAEPPPVEAYDGPDASEEVIKF